MPAENSIKVTNGSDIVAGHLTAFFAAEGDQLNANGVTVPILRVDSNAQMILAYPWPAATNLEIIDTHWSIIRGPYWNSTVVVAERVNDLIERLDAGLPLDIDAYGTLAERAQYDAAPKGFKYFNTASDPFKLSVKRSEAVADWTPEQAIRTAATEPGPPGPPGPAGSPGPTNLISIASTQTLAPNEPAYFNLQGTSPGQVGYVGIPQGVPGQTGATPTLQKGNAVTGASGSAFDFQLRATGQPNAYFVDMTVPAGPPGSTGTVLQTNTYNALTNGALTLGLGDANRRVRSNIATDHPVVVPPATTAAFPLHTRIEVSWIGAGKPTITAGNGVTINWGALLGLRERYATVWLQNVGTNVWDTGGEYEGTGDGGPIVTLQPLTLSNTTIAEESVAGTVVGNIQGLTSGSFVDITDDAGGRFTVVNNQVRAGLVPTNFETGTFHNIKLEETKPGAFNSPRVTDLTITVTNIVEPTTVLNVLTLATPTMTENTPPGVLVSAINGLTTGSIRTLPNDDGGRFQIVGNNLLTGPTNVDFDAIAPAGGPTRTISIREELPGASNSPRTTPLNITVVNVNETVAMLDPANTKAGMVLSNSNLTVTTTTANSTMTRSTVGVSSGRWGAEVHFPAINGTRGIEIGFGNSAVPDTASQDFEQDKIMSTVNGFSCFIRAPIWGHNSAFGAALSGIAAAVSGDRFRILADFTLKLAWISRNGGDWNGIPGTNPAAATAQSPQNGFPFPTLAAGPYNFMIHFWRDIQNTQAVVNFGTPAVAYPAGFGLLNAAPGVGGEPLPDPNPDPEVPSNPGVITLTSRRTSTLLITTAGTVVSNIDFDVPGTAIEIRARDVTVKDCRIAYRNGDGIRVHPGSHGFKFQRVYTRKADAPVNAQQSNQNESQHGFEIEGSSNGLIEDCRSDDPSTMIYQHGGSNDNISRRVYCLRPRGPFGRGQIWQCNASSRNTLDTFFCDAPKENSWPEDVVNSNNNSVGSVIRNGFLRGNNSPSGWGIIFEPSATGGIVEDVDTQYMGCGAFYDMTGSAKFYRCRDFDHINGDQGRGKPMSDQGAGALHFGAYAYGTEFHSCQYARPANTTNILWNVSNVRVNQISRNDSLQPKAPPYLFPFTFQTTY